MRRELLTEMIHVGHDNGGASERARRLHDAFAGLVRDGQRDGVMSSKHQLDTATELLTGAFYSLMFNWVHLEIQQQQLGTPDEPASFSPEQRRNLAEILEATFGTPQDPKLPGGLAEVNVESLVDLYNLKMAAGPVGRDEASQEPRGLYRQHCAHVRQWPAEV